MHELKFGIFGLDNAGKSTLLYALKNIYGYEEKIKSFKPTVRIHHETQKYYNLSVNYWDFGGQEAFREEYLENPKNFERMDILLFMIDIQDETRFTQSLDYLNRILNTLNDSDYDKTQEIQICLSKSDCEVVQACHYDFDSRLEMIQNLVLTRFPEFKFKFYTTSIFNIYSLCRMLSMIFHPYFIFSSALDSALNNFAQQLQLDTALIFDSAGIILSQYLQEEVLPFFDYSSTNDILDSHLRIGRQLHEREVQMSPTTVLSNETLISCYQFQVSSTKEMSDDEKIEQLIQTETTVPPSSEYYLSVLTHAENEDTDQISEAINTFLISVQEILAQQLDTIKREED